MWRAILGFLYFTNILKEYPRLSLQLLQDTCCPHSDPYTGIPHPLSRTSLTSCPSHIPRHIHELPTFLNTCTASPALVSVAYPFQPTPSPSTASPAPCLHARWPETKNMESKRHARAFLVRFLVCGRVCDLAHPRPGHACHRNIASHNRACHWRTRLHVHRQQQRRGRA